MSNIIGTNEELIQFNILKTQTKAERLFVITFFAMFYFVIVYILINSLGDKTTTRIALGVLLLAIIGVDRIYDNAIRNRIIGTGKLYTNKICLNNNDYDFKHIIMLWVNRGLNTKSTNGGEMEMITSINDYETLKLTIIEANDKLTHVHIDNSSNTFNIHKVSEHIEYVRRNFHSFKIHFDDENSNFSKEEYLKVVRRHELMKSSLKRRKK